MYNPIQAHQFYLDGMWALTKIEEAGIKIDVNYCKKKRKQLNAKIAYYKQSFKEGEMHKVWRKRFGAKTNINSDDQLRKVLFEEMGYKSDSTTEKGLASVDQSSLEKIEHPDLEDLIYYGQLSKMNNTYLENILRETDPLGFLHPMFNLTNVVTTRSSASNINFQNQPERVKFMKRMIKRSFIPRPGHMLAEIDYGGIEVKTAACYHKDPEMLKEINDSSKDMHRDSAQMIYMLKEKQMTKMTRYSAKNGFVFPQFYGDWYKSCAKYMWENIDTLDLKTAQGAPLKVNLKKKGIKNLSDFEEHMKEVEHWFWKKKFKVYDKWRNDWYDQYLTNGYVDSLTGFRFHHIMTRNKVINCPIQGSAFHFLLWSLIELLKWMMKVGSFRSRIIGQIHDSIVLDLHPEEAEEILTMVKLIMTEKIKEYWDWIIVPLVIDIELTPVNTSWYEIDEVTTHRCEQCNFLYQYKSFNESSGFYDLSCPNCRKESNA